MLQLKNLRLNTHVIQSPMAGCTDLAFRLIAREHGMEFSFLEMVSAEALVRDNQKTRELLKSVPEDRPLGAQLFGCKPDTMAEAAAIIEDMGFDLLDLNLGCPVPKITSPGSGSALLQKPETAGEIFRAVKKNLKRIPLTVKMRKGYADPSGEEAVTIARLAEDAGVDAVTVHGRTRAQGYSGDADWEAIGKVKRAVKIPVIGNGDVTSGEAARELLRVSGADGIMIGRGSLGNPWIFKSVEAVLNGEPPAPGPDLETIKKTALKHFELEIQTEGEHNGLLKGRKILCWYFKNFPRSAELRDRINRSEKIEEVKTLVAEFNGEN